MSLECEGLCLDVLVDTGSTNTLVDYAVINCFVRVSPMTEYTGRLIALTGHVLPVVGQCVIDILNCKLNVMVVHKLDNCHVLLGCDFLKKAAAVIDMDQNVISCNDICLPLKPCENVSADEPRGGCLLNAAPIDSNLPQIASVVSEFTDVFSDKATPVARADLPSAEISTGCTEPIKQRAYRIPDVKRKVVEENVEQMLKDGIIRPSHSPWASPITLVPKKDGSMRFCVDYRRLNAVTKKDAYPLPRTQEVFDQLRGAEVFSTLDLKSGYWQMPMSETSKEKTAFTCHLGLFEFNRLPFGLTNAPAMFQRAIASVLTGLIGRCVMLYIDDIVVFSKTEEEHAKHLREVLQRLRKTGLQLKLSKCSFGKREIDLLGHRVDAVGIKPLPERVEAVKRMAPPRNTREVRSFLGFVGYYRSLIPNFSEIAVPISELTKAKQPYVWGQEQNQAFEKLKQALTKSTVIAHPDMNRPYVLHTDASDKAIGAVLSQRDDHGRERVVSYYSSKLSEAQQRWSTIEKEAFAVVQSLRKFDAYVHGADITVRTDHKPLRSLFSAEIRNTKLQRWAIQISEYNPRIEYTPGKLNVVADMLSRSYAVRSSRRVTLLPPNVVPDVWKTDNIDIKELISAQQAEFNDEFLEARQESDDSPYVIQDGLLYTAARPAAGSEQYLRIILPQRYREKVIARCHEEVAHAGFLKTLSRVQESYVWYGMRRHTRQFISHCIHCRTLTPPNPTILNLGMPQPPRAFHTWAIDLVGPFPRDKTGKQYLLTCIDYLTGWAEAIPLASKKAALVREAIAYHLVARYGLPEVILSDNGGEFTGSVIEDWMRECGIRHHKTSPYHPQSNGKVERFNGTIQRLLLKLTGGNARLWSKYLAEALYAYRITHGPTGISPYQAIYGVRPRLPKVADNSDEGDRLRAIRIAEKFLQQERSGKELDAPASKLLPPGTFVSVRVRDPHKGQAKWRPGYQILTNYKGGLRLLELESGREIRMNQRDVREIPAPRPYDEIDPPKSRVLPKVTIDPICPVPIPIPARQSVSHVPSAAKLNPDALPFYPRCNRRSDEWCNWLKRVTEFMC